MALEILSDKRVRSVEWKDLVPLSPFEITRELLLPLPWLAGSLYLAHLGYILPALGVSFMFFLLGLRVVHNAYHYALGIPRWATEWVIFFLSCCMLGSLHAVQINHIRHHKHCMDDEDMEAISARMSWWQALLFGPIFPVMLHWAAFKYGRRRHHIWIVAEIAATIFMIVLAFGILDYGFLQYHIIAMAVGNSLTAFFAVWTVHHDCDRSHHIARTLRSPIKNTVTFSMFYHVEHHLYPKVPTCHLHLLADRLDEKAPELKNKQVF